MTPPYRAAPNGRVSGRLFGLLKLLLVVVLLVLLLLVVVPLKKKNKS